MTDSRFDPETMKKGAAFLVKMIANARREAHEECAMVCEAKLAELEKDARRFAKNRTRSLSAEATIITVRECMAKIRAL